MPIYEPQYVEYSITDALMRVALDDGEYMPAYWAHPTLGTKFPGIVLVHDWWGLTPVIRRMATMFAQLGHYVMVPDLFNGEIAETPKQAIGLVENSRQHHSHYIHSALTVLEQHHHCNKSLAVVGVGMGGSLAFESAIKRDNLHASIAFSGFPNRFIGKFRHAKSPICAFYGEKEPHIKSEVIQAMRTELSAQKPLYDHEIHIISQMGHDFFTENIPVHLQPISRHVIGLALDFLDRHLASPSKQGDKWML
jgi:carboxymethylenebutenolidase